MGPTEAIFPQEASLPVVGRLRVGCLHREVFPTVAKAEGVEVPGGHWEYGGRCGCTTDILVPFFCETILTISSEESHFLHSASSGDTPTPVALLRSR